jgi:glycosyltransferase involved in cell wall biosynthesis
LENTAALDLPRKAICAVWLSKRIKTYDERKMKISVIICALDKKKILPGVIPSIKSSPIVDELIIVEGLSPVGYARDVGWRKAKSSLICFIDDDEIVPKGWFERLTKEFDDPKVGAVWGTIKPLNRNKINTLDSILQNHTLRKTSLNARFVRKKALEEIGGYKHTIGGETVYAALKMVKQGWRIKIVDCPLLHKLHENSYEWIMNIYGTGKIRAQELKERGELPRYFKKALGSFPRSFQLSIIYKEPLFLIFYPLRCWLFLIGTILGDISP